MWCQNNWFAYEYFSQTISCVAYRRPNDVVGGCSIIELTWLTDGFGIIKHSLHSFMSPRRPSQRNKKVFLFFSLPRTINNEILQWREFSLRKYHLITLVNSPSCGILSAPYFIFIVLQGSSLLRLRWYYCFIETTVLSLQVRQIKQNAYRTNNKQRGEELGEGTWAHILVFLFFPFPTFAHHPLAGVMGTGWINVGWHLGRVVWLGKLYPSGPSQNHYWASGTSPLAPIRAINNVMSLWTSHNSETQLLWTPPLSPSESKKRVSQWCPYSIFAVQWLKESPQP